jgi:hypothetical protein
MFLENSDVLKCALEFKINNTRCIDELYSAIVLIVNLATDMFIPKVRFKPYIKPYWNPTLRNLHQDLKLNRIKWINDNRSKVGKSYIDYKNSKKKFRKVHRQASLSHTENQEKEIDDAAEFDNNEFWRLINKRRKKTSYTSGFEMNFDGVLHKDPKIINEKWMCYFKDLYSPSSDPSFDDEFFNQINREIDELKGLMSTHNVPPFVIEESSLSEALKTCKNKKSLWI